MADDRFYVKTLRLQNFRCFEDVELGPFDPHFNLLVGENGAGKSSVLVALAQLYRIIVDMFWVVPDERLTSDQDVRVGQNSTKPSKAENLSFILNSTYIWQGKQRDLSGNLDIFEKNRILGLNNAEKLQFLNIGPVPLIVRFTANRRFVRNHFDDLRSPIVDQRGDAFVGWSDAGATSDEFLRWIRDETLVDFDRVREAGSWRKDNETALGMVRGACVEAVKGARDLYFNGSFKDIIIYFEDGRKLLFGNMSDGQRALIGMVSEIARRAYVLNSSILGKECLEKTPGLILIDEIDLHLHPKWQRQIVPALKKIFPKIQFFATTHSPQVIGECKPEEIVLLTPQGQRRPSGGYGRDSNWILECVMDAEGRDPEIALRLKTLFNLIEDEKFDEARIAIKALRQDIGYGPDIVGAEAYLWRMEHLGDEAAE